MTEFMILFILCFLALIGLSEPETLAECSERANVKRLADESRKRKAPGMRRACRYVEAGWRPGGK